MAMVKCAAILVLFTVQTTRQVDESCKVSLFRFWPPVVLSSDTLDFIYPSLEIDPSIDRNLTISPGKSIIISCDGGRFENITTTNTISAICNQDLQFEVQDAILDIDAVNCINFSPVRVVQSSECAPGAVNIEVGFKIGRNIKFLPQIVVCFDTVKVNPLYANYNLTKAIGYIKSYLQTSYKVDYWYYQHLRVDLEQLYDFHHQQKTINKLLGLEENSTKYVDPHSCSPSPGVTTPGFCFTKRPLTYRGNFVYISQQYATYRYINVAPQWYFVDYNLNQLEYDVIAYVKSNRLDLEVFTGNYGVATLPSETTGEAVELFLHVQGDVRAIPVPWIYWKLVYDRWTRRGTVFLTVNNPYMTDVAENVICADVSDQIPWLKWQKHNITKGYSYACSYPDAKSAISYLPNIEVEGLLV